MRQGLPTGGRDSTHPPRFRFGILIQRRAGVALNSHQPPAPDSDPQETSEWIESLESTHSVAGRERTGDLMDRLVWHSRSLRIPAANHSITPYQNSIAPDQETAYPGDEEMEQRIENLVRWNAMAMVVRANSQFDGLGPLDGSRA